MATKKTETKPKRKAGRPSTGRYDNVVNELIEYTDNTAIPIIAEFSYMHNYPRQVLYKKAETDEALNDAIKRCIAKKEYVLEKGALTGELQQTMAIFSLKQLGWRDKVESEKEDDESSSGVVMIAPVLENANE